MDYYAKYSELRRDIDSHRWGYNDTLILITMISTFFVWGVVLSIAPLITTWPFIPKYFDVYIIFSSPAGLLLGNFFLGYISDKSGRKKLFLFTVILTSFGLIGISLLKNPYLMIFFIFISEFGLGGDETISLAYLSELLPLKYRGVVLIETSNVANISIVIMAAIFLFIPSSVYIDKFSLFTIAILGFIISFITRLKLSESIRWDYLKKHNIKEKIKINFKKIINFISLSFIAITIVVGFAFSSLVLGPYEFPKYSSLIIFGSTIGGTITGIIGGFYMGKSRRKIVSLIGYTGMFIVWLIVLIFLKFILSNILYLIIMISISGIFGEFGWASREMLEPENFETSYRGMGIGGVRMVGYSVYIISVFLLANKTIYFYLYYLLIIYLIGFLGSIIYYIYGRETKDMSVI
ncbi:MFS transporter [Acidiplasma sp.]|uniref:MFS transporter n=1 Tax=Acidiplasma sp. TaxID=1872114 RepID=UPI00258FAEE6|nr:MFS transporter [Acidiplasma sp.]